MSVLSLQKNGFPCWLRWFRQGQIPDFFLLGSLIDFPDKVANKEKPEIDGNLHNYKLFNPGWERFDP